MNCINTGHDFKTSGNETRSVGVDVLFKDIYLHYNFPVQHLYVKLSENPSAVVLQIF